MVKISPLPKLPDVQLIQTQRFQDSRGFFMESFRASWLNDHGIDATFCQDNMSLSVQMGTVRGLHFQYAPHGQGKLVQCLQGTIWDVAVDIRPDSATFGVWDAVTLSAEGNEQLYIPPGFAHGFMTLNDNCLVTYKCTAYYKGDAEGAISYADPSLAIDWPKMGSAPLLSEKDKAAMSFQEFRTQELRSQERKTQERKIQNSSTGAGGS